MTDTQIKNHREQQVKHIHTLKVIRRLETAAIILITFGIVMLFIGVFTPPLWEIHASLIQGFGEILAAASIITVLVAMEKGTDAQWKFGQSEVKINNPDLIQQGEQLD